MKQVRKLLRNFRLFKRSESGSLTVEAVLVFPLLLWTATATFVWFDGFRQSALNAKASYTIGDLISRETETINDTYITSLYLLMQRMINNESRLSMRVSLLVYDGDDKRHYVQWSTARGYSWIWTDDNVGQLRDALPPMPHRDTLILVETSNKYDPVFSVNLLNANLSKDISFENFVFTRPRFTNEIAAVFKTLIIDQEDVGNDLDDAEEATGT